LLPADGRYYVCGPEAFMQQQRAALRARGIDGARIQCEVFGPSLVGHLNRAVAGHAMNALRDWFTAFLPARSTADRSERIRACFGALLGIFVTGITSYWLIGSTPQLPMLIAPLGASAVLLFAVPNGPLAQPWSIVGGNTLSAVVGVTALMLFDDLAVAAALGVG